MKIFKYTFVFFLLTLNLNLYSTTTNTTVVNNYYITNTISYPANENVIVEDKYEPNDANIWKEEASKNDDTYSFWYWLINVSVLGTGGLCFLSYFLFPEWFLLLVTILGLLYVLNFFVQITSPTSLCLFNFETQENFESYSPYDPQKKPKIESVIIYEHGVYRKNSEGKDETKIEFIRKEPEKISNYFTFDRKIDYHFEENNKPLIKYKIDLFIEKGEYYFAFNQLLTNIFEEKTRNFIPCCADKKHRIKRNVYCDVPNIGNYMLIATNISDKPWHVSFWWFLLFTILPFSQLYKLWVNRYCDEGAAKITYTIIGYDPPHF